MPRERDTERTAGAPPADERSSPTGPPEPSPEEKPKRDSAPEGAPSEPADDFIIIGGEPP